MRVRVVKCSNPIAWYKNKIGKIYGVVLSDDDKYYYATSHPEHTKHTKFLLHVADCEDVYPETFLDLPL